MIFNGPPCQKPIRCLDFRIRHCVRPIGHNDGCNPFSDTVYHLGIQKDEKKPVSNVYKLTGHRLASREIVYSKNKIAS